MCIACWQPAWIACASTAPNHCPSLVPDDRAPAASRAGDPPLMPYSNGCSRSLKIRTGPLEPRPAVIKSRPKRGRMRDPTRPRLLGLAVASTVPVDGRCLPTRSWGLVGGAEGGGSHRVDGCARRLPKPTCRGRDRRWSLGGGPQNGLCRPWHRTLSSPQAENSARGRSATGHRLGD